MEIFEQIDQSDPKNLSIIDKLRTKCLEILTDIYTS